MASQTFCGRGLRLIFPLVMAMLASSCLFYETKEYRFTLSEDGRSIAVETTYHNLISTEDSTWSANVQEDFDELIRDLNSDEVQGFDIDRSDIDSLYKQLWLEDGKLVGYQALFYKKNREIFDYVYTDSTGEWIEFPIELFSEEVVLEADGRIHPRHGDIVFIQWPVGTREFYVKTGFPEFPPYEGIGISLARVFQAYQDSLEE